MMPVFCCSTLLQATGIYIYIHMQGQTCNVIACAWSCVWLLAAIWSVAKFFHCVRCPSCVDPCQLGALPTALEKTMARLISFGSRALQRIQNGCQREGVQARHDCFAEDVLSAVKDSSDTWTALLQLFAEPLSCMGVLAQCALPTDGAAWNALQIWNETADLVATFLPRPWREPGKLGVARAPYRDLRALAL